MLFTCTSSKLNSDNFTNKIISLKWDTENESSLKNYITIMKFCCMGSNAADIDIDLIDNDFCVLKVVSQHIFLYDLV